MKIIKNIAIITLVSSLASLFTYSSANETSTNYERALAQSLATVKSEIQLVEELKDSSSPLNLMSNDAKHEFVNSISFSEKGITSFNYKVLESELTPTEIYRVLSLFGMQRLVPMFKDARIVTESDYLLMNRPENTSNSGLSKSEFGTSDFGAEKPVLDADHKGYRCSARATCSRSMSEICTSNC
ncbi:hypothetical protein [Pseudidiomarina sediminum]|uniref:hypothetical protein n=1 Tax=Pseudidiomarina sediminum TaxID=431675 RepID=UPI001C98301D|nr:hypothetical protein [Pseudidiomarina sediminum]MBY6064562.1 hypothetical protein [Pseudidiomarina sediminum]